MQKISSQKKHKFEANYFKCRIATAPLGNNVSHKNTLNILR